MNILITGHDSFRNKGCQALIFTTTEIMKQAFPDANFTVFSWEPEFDQANYDNPSIECKFIQHRFQTNDFSLRNKIWLTINKYGIKTDRILWVKPSFYNAIKSCDLMVVSGGDILADYGETSVKHCFFPIAIAKALKKPVFVFAQSISPYKSDELLNFARHYLNKVDLITVREGISYEYLKNIKIKTPSYLTADPAFLLQPSSEERLKNILNKEGISMDSSLTVGISVSETLTKWGGSNQENFLKTMAAVCDSIIRQYRARLIFVPHVMYPDDPSNDDRVVSEKVRNIMKEKGSVYLLRGDYSCRDLKSVIGKCDVLIGARTHATIASASQHIPTLALAYSTKAFGIMEDVLDREKCTCDISKVTLDELLGKTVYLIENREQIRESASSRLRIITERAYMNGSLAQEVFGGTLTSKR
jgi:polysaccharide pyruvyl transferase WcaK-like protein